jgi:hypothetical protein
VNEGRLQSQDLPHSLKLPVVLALEVQQGRNRMALSSNHACHSQATSPGALSILLREALGMLKEEKRELRVGSQGEAVSFSACCLHGEA